MMSKYEDRTDPWFVKARRHRVEKHDHRNGVCDLQADLNNTSYQRGECHLDVNWYDPEMRCSCNMCSMGLKEDGRKRRAEGERQARNWRKDYE